MKESINAKDLINVGLFTALYFIIGCVVVIPVGFIPVFFPLLAGIWPLVTGIPFMLFLTRVKKFGLVTIMCTLSGLLMGLTGMGFWGVPIGFVSGLVADLYMKSGEYKSTKKGIVGYGIFSLWMVGTYVPIYFMAEQAYKDFESGFGTAYADQAMNFMPSWSFALIIAACFVFGMLGGVVGTKVLKKHFAKAGIV